MKVRTMKKHKRGFLNIFLTAMLVSVLALASGCAAKNWTLDEEGLTNNLLESIKFDCTMYQVQTDRVADFIEIENTEKQILYMGNGAYADSLGIFTLADESSAQTALETVNAYLEDLGNSFRDYLPDEAAEVDEAVTVQKGRFVVFCVSPDSQTAAQLIDAAIKEGDSETTESTDASEEEPQQMNNKAVGEYPAVTADGKSKNFGNVIQIGDTGFELYSYTEKAAETYAASVNRTAGKLKGISDVYEVLIPLSSAVTLPDDYFGKIKSSNQRKALDKIIKKAGSDVKVVDMYDRLMEHRDEYIYFRTDHHWTSLGAYYGYERFCEEKGIMPITAERRENADFGDFLGSFYADTKKSQKMEKHPDRLKVYYPISKNLSLRYTNQKGQKGNWDVIHDVSNYPLAIKYSAFIAGDNPYTMIKNKDITDGSSCIVIKESFGNAFVPYLTDHYSKIYVIDYRYWDGDLFSFAQKKKVNDVIFVNNLSMIRSDYLTGRLAQITK